MQLTEHFHLSEFTNSSTAEKHHIDNTIPPEYIPNLQRLCTRVLEPLRHQFNDKPIIILSGYRSSELNRQVNGRPKSYHQSGRAADIPFVPGHLAYIRDHLPHRELINEGTWIHVAL